MARQTLDRPPSDRYATTESDGSSGRAGGYATVAALAGLGLILLVGGILESTTGLVFVAGVTGAAIGLLYAGSSRPRASVRRRSILAAVVVVVVGAIGIWLLALQQGGALGFLDFLWATSGILVPVELAVAALAAAWGAGAGPVRG
jgi:hypothetical protein